MIRNNSRRFLIESLALVALLAASCAADKPSPEFNAAKTKLEEVIGETFDDSFSDPKFVEVQRAFEAIPEKDKNYERAQEYVKKISEAQASKRPRNDKKPSSQQKIESQAKTKSTNKTNQPNVQANEEKSPQRQAYDKAINDFKKAEKVRGEKLKAVMKEIDTLTK